MLYGPFAANKQKYAFYFLGLESCCNKSCSGVKYAEIIFAFTLRREKEEPVKWRER